ncbi:type II toxin-antitoxin system HigB family toxin [Dyadobacter bucti]|uniref:type II toxin-antitoxin system HigB family toxin n=1 Tax=Dyadobacter bucti TaxID=2572203 RepID=UPI003F722507
MVVISYRIIREYGEKNRASFEAWTTWYNITQKADWAHFHEVKTIFKSVAYAGNDLYVFNIRGNHVRIIVRILFKVRTVYIKFIGTHAEYDKVKLD